MTRTRTERRDEADAAWFRGRAVSCPECGVICMRLGGRPDDARPFDVPASGGERMVALAFGLGALLAQGVGVGNGSRHVCPPVPKGAPYGPSD